MAIERLPRDRQRGNSLVLALIVMSALATLGSLTVVSVQSSLKASTNDRSQAIALYAAESGAAYAMDFLRANALSDWTPYFTPPNVSYPVDPNFPANRAQPKAGGNPFSDDQNAWFEIRFMNNAEDTAADTDKRVIIHSTGHGPLGSVAIVEWEVKLDNPHSNSFILVGWHVVDL